MPDPINLTASAPYFLAAFLFGYLLGSIPFGLLLTRMAGLGDVRSIGSGNIGATNVLRTGRKDVAAATLLLDAAKGFAAVFIAGSFFGPAIAALAAIGALVGHCYPVWLRFKGGKGVATFLGILVALSWPHAALFAAIWLTLAFTLRYSSLAALVACLCVPISAFLFSPASLFGSKALGEVTIILVVLIFWKHRENIKRLLTGQESRIGSAKSEPSATSEHDG